MAKRRRSRYPGLSRPPNSPHWQYRFTVNGRRVSVSTEETDLDKAWDRASAIKEAARAEARDPFARYARMPISEHLDGWETSLKAASVTVKHIGMLVSRVNKVIAGCRFRVWGDVTRSAVETFLTSLRRRDARAKGQRGVSTRTRNFYVAAIKQFAKWMCENERAAQNPLATLKRERGVKADLRHERRAFTADEWRALVRIVATLPPSYGVSGPDRSRLYAFSGMTGLRANEIRTLRWSAVDLKSETPTVTVKASYSKNGEPRTVPLQAEIATMMRQWRAERSSESPFAAAFKMPYPTSTARMLHADLDQARQKWIEESGGTERARREQSDFLRYHDGAGRFADFHSFRHSYASWLARAGVPVKTAQELLGHKTVAQTLEIYSHVLLPDQAVAVEKALPAMTALVPQPSASAAG